jgi:hypothetical protein
VNPADESIVSIIARVASAPVPNLRPLGVPNRLATAIETAMVKDPLQRTQSADAFRLALEDAVADPAPHMSPLPPVWAPAPLVPPTGVTGPPGGIARPPDLGLSSPPDKPSKESTFPLAIAIVIVLAIAIAIGIIVYVMTRHGPATPVESSLASWVRWPLL